MMEDDAVVGVTSNPTIFQKAIAQGDAYDEQLKELAGKVEDDPKELFLELSAQDVAEACDLLRPVFDATDGVDGYVSWEVDPTLAYDRERDVRRGPAAPRVGRPAEPLREDPGDEAGPRRDRGHDRRGQEHQRDADLLAAALRGGRRGLPARARAARRLGRRTRSRSRRSRASSSPASTPRPTGGSRRSARRPRSRSAASSRSRTRSSPTSTTSRPSRGRAGSSSPARAPGRSAASGPRPRRRTPPTAT